MKQINTNILTLFLLLLIFSSCSVRTNIRNSGLKEALEAYSDVLNIKKTEIYFMSSPPHVRIELYVRDDANPSNEQIAVIRNTLLDFLRDTVTETGWHGNAPRRYNNFIGFGYHGFFNIDIKIHFPKNQDRSSYEIGFGRDTPSNWAFRAWFFIGFLIGDHNLFTEFENFIMDNDEKFQQLLRHQNNRDWHYWWGIVQTQSNGVGFVFSLNDGIDFEESDVEMLMSFMSDFLNTDSFNLYIENNEWIFVGENFHVNLFFVMQNDEVIEYIAHKHTNYSIWELIN